MTIDTRKLGPLLLSAVLGAAAFGALQGFQGNTMPKFATVDIAKVFDESNLAQTNSETLETARKQRANILNYIATNRAMEPADARKYAELSAKATPTDADKKELDRIRGVAEAATSKQRELTTKSPLTDADRAAIADFGSKAQTNAALLQGLQQQYENDLQTMGTDLREKTLDRVREVVANLAAKQGYTVVFSTNSAPYAANDLTSDAQKALKK